MFHKMDPGTQKLHSERFYNHHVRNTNKYCIQSYILVSCSTLVGLQKRLDMILLLHSRLQFAPILSAESANLCIVHNAVKPHYNSHLWAEH